MTTLTLSLIPNEIKYCIIDCLHDDISSRKALAAVCKVFHELISHYNLSVSSLYTFSYLHNKTWEEVNQEKIFCYYEKFPVALKCCSLQKSSFNHLTLNGTSSTLFCVDQQGRRYEACETNHIGTPLFYISSFQSPSHKSIFFPSYQQDLYDPIFACHIAKNHHVILVREWDYLFFQWDKNQLDLELKYQHKLCDSDQNSDFKIIESVYFRKTLLFRIREETGERYCSILPFEKDSDLQNLTLSQEILEQIGDRKSLPSLRAIGKRLYIEYKKEGVYRKMRVNCQENEIVSAGSPEISEDFDFWKPPIAYGPWHVCIQAEKLLVFKDGKVWIPPTYKYFPVFEEEYEKCRLTYFINSDCLFLVYKNKFRTIYLPEKQEITKAFSYLTKILDENSTLYALALNVEKADTSVVNTNEDEVAERKLTEHPSGITISATIFKDTLSGYSNIDHYTFYVSTESTK